MQEIFVDPSGFFNVSEKDPVKDIEVDAQILDFINTQLNGGFMEMMGKYGRLMYALIVQ